MATKAVTHYAISIRLACRIFKVSESCYRYQPVLVDENQEIADWLLRITASQRNWGFGLCFLYLRNVQGFGWNHKRVYRIYRAGNGWFGLSQSRWRFPTSLISAGRWTLCMTSSAMAARCGCLM